MLIKQGIKPHRNAVHLMSSLLQRCLEVEAFQVIVWALAKL